MAKIAIKLTKKSDIVFLVVLNWWVTVESNYSPKDRFYRPAARTASFNYPKNSMFAATQAENSLYPPMIFPSITTHG